ncbi:MAG TPA: AMP-binding protein [Burkholderiales bacterium]|nr:AMP-binding protein [Burkholderiales bacterium]
MADLPIARHNPGAPFGHRNGKLAGIGEFLADVAHLATLLPDRRHVVNLCADRYQFAVGFAAALLRAQVSLMPPNHTADLIARLVRDYPDVYGLSDGAAQPGLEIVRCPPPLESRALPAVIPAVPEERTAAIVFTSGSTGDPLPHPKSWGGLVASAMAEIERLGIQMLPGMAILGTVPPQHMYGLESTVVMALQGGLILHAGRPFFPADVCAELEALPRPRGLVTTPVHLRAVLAEGTGLPRVDFLLSATAPLSPQLAAEAEARFAAPLHEIYGCTEAGQLATRRTTETPEWQLYPRFAMRQDEKGTWVKGGHARTEFLLSDVIELLDGDRFLLHGRTADVVNIAGKRTSLAALNYHLNSIGGVRDGAFFLPEDDDGEVARLIAFVVAPGLSHDTVMAALRQRIDPAFLPRPLCIVDSLPRNATGKLPRVSLDTLATRLTAKAG